MTSLSGPPVPLYERAARLWLQGHDSYSIANNLRVREHVIYNAMGTIRSIAADLRPLGPDVLAQLADKLKRTGTKRGTYKRREA